MAPEIGAINPKYEAGCGHPRHSVAGEAYAENPCSYGGFTGRTEEDRRYGPQAARWRSGGGRWRPPNARTASLWERWRSLQSWTLLSPFQVGGARPRCHLRTT